MKCKKWKLWRKKKEMNETKRRITTIIFYPLKVTIYMSNGVWFANHFTLASNEYHMHIFQLFQLALLARSMHECKCCLQNVATTKLALTPINISFHFTLLSLSNLHMIFILFSFSFLFVTFIVNECELEQHLS